MELAKLLEVSIGIIFIGTLKYLLLRSVPFLNIIDQSRLHLDSYIQSLSDRYSFSIRDLDY